MLYCKHNQRSLAVDQYQRKALLADQNKEKGLTGLQVPILGLFGETGSLLSQVKRKRREKFTFSSYEDAVIEELGDVLWYLANLASRHRVSLSSIALFPYAQAKRQRLTTSPALTFSKLQSRCRHQKYTRRRMADSDFFALGDTVGELMREFYASNKGKINHEQLLVCLSKIFHLLVLAAIEAKISLNLAAQNNLAKIQSKWPRHRKFSPLFDERYKKVEQLPRYIEMYFDERIIKGKAYVYQSCRGINIGDRLTDNKIKEDDYRFHDVFHLSYAAFLGWSPVSRALFRVKRKTYPKVDENEDGARAILIEEGIATWIFNHGIDNHYFRFVSKIDYSLLKAIRYLVSGYEVERCPLWQWEKAILEGFRVFRLLRKKRRGVVIADLHKRTLDYREKPVHEY